MINMMSSSICIDTTVIEDFGDPGKAFKQEISRKDRRNNSPITITYFILDHLSPMSNT